MRRRNEEMPPRPLWGGRIPMRELTLYWSYFVSRRRPATRESHDDGAKEDDENLPARKPLKSPKTRKSSPRRALADFVPTRPAAKAPASRVFRLRLRP